MVELLINQSCVDVNVQDEYGLTPMSKAATWGYSRIIDILARAGADPDIASIFGETPVHMAALWGYTDAVKALAETGANIDKKGGLNDSTPLMVAVFFGYKDVVEYLLKQGVDVNARDIHDKTALYWARWSNHRAIAKLLRAFGATL